MKYLFFLFLALLFLISKVSSQNPNMVDFQVTCNDNTSPACNAMSLYNQAGQIVSDNLRLSKRISVKVVVEKRTETFWGATLPSKVYNSVDGIRRYFPTALVKQVQPGFSYDGPDISVTINSNQDPKTYYHGSDPIKSNQYDFLELVLHELQHGLGFETTWYHVQTVQGRQHLFPAFDYDENNGVITFHSFKENLFDFFLITYPIGKNAERATPYVKELNTMAGPEGKTYNGLDDFYTQIVNIQQQQGKSYTSNMLAMATLPFRMGFVTTDDHEDITLETSYNPFKLGSSISHFAKEYFDSPDFLLIPESRPGKTLADKITATGNYPGEGMGPYLRAMLETMGYTLLIPVGNPNKIPISITTNNSTDSKLKRVVKNRNKKKRIIAF